MITMWVGQRGGCTWSTAVAAAAAVGALGAATAVGGTREACQLSTVAIRVQNIVLIFSAAVAAVANTVKLSYEEFLASFINL